MTTILNSITQEEYNKLAVEFFEETSKYRGPKFYQFYANIQQRLLERLTAKFAAIGLIFEKISSQAGVNKMHYRVLDPTGQQVIINWLDFSFVMKQITNINHPVFTNIPDVKLVNPQYTEERIEEVATVVFNGFLEEKNRAQLNKPEGGININPETTPKS